MKRSSKRRTLTLLLLVLKKDHVVGFTVLGLYTGQNGCFLQKNQKTNIK